MTDFLASAFLVVGLLRQKSFLYFLPCGDLLTTFCTNGHCYLCGEADVVVLNLPVGAELGLLVRPVQQPSVGRKALHESLGQVENCTT